MSTSACPICGRPAAPNHRYCTDCDFQARQTVAGPALQAAGGSTVRRGGEMRLFLFVFFLTVLVTVLLGMNAAKGLSFPAMLGLADPEAAAAVDWGEIRFVHTATRIRAGRTTESAIIGRLAPGDSIRADFAEGGWLAVFPANAAARDVKQALGYVYAPLLKARHPGAVGGAAP